MGCKLIAYVAMHKKMGSKWQSENFFVWHCAYHIVFESIFNKSAWFVLSELKYIWSTKITWNILNYMQQYVYIYLINMYIYI